MKLGNRLNSLALFNSFSRIPTPTADSVVQVLDERGEGYRLSKADFTTAISSEGNLRH
jgi:hypothetical protein